MTSKTEESTMNTQSVDETDGTKIRRKYNDKLFQRSGNETKRSSPRAEEVF